MKTDFKTVSSNLLLKLHFILNNSLLFHSEYFSNEFSSEHSRGAAFAKYIKLQGFLKLKIFLVNPFKCETHKMVRHTQKFVDCCC